MNEIIVHSQAGAVSFPNYQDVYNQAVELAENISQLEVTEENVKHTKKLLATVNKRVTELEDQRKAVKKQLLEPYEAFEQQVKQIVSVVKEADTMVRQQVKTLEEQERSEKQLKIEDLFYKRLLLYPELAKLFYIEHFIEPKHLNKTTSFNKVEEEMVEWFQKRSEDVKFINSIEDGAEVLFEYVKCLNPVTAIQIVRDRKIQKEVYAGRQEVKSAKTVTIEFDEVWFSQVHVFLKMSGIPYIKK